VSVNQFGVTTDLWTHQHTNDSYVTVTIQYIKDWKLRSCILATRLMNERHTAEHVRNAVKGLLEAFSAMRPGNVYVSDNASNMKAAFRDNTWFGCACHNLNLVLSHGLQAGTSSDSEDGLPQEITELIDSCKELVTLAKRTKLNSQLETTLRLQSGKNTVPACNNTLFKCRLQLAVQLSALPVFLPLCSLCPVIWQIYRSSA